MARFVAGFVVATVLWGGATVYVYFTGTLSFEVEETALAEVTATDGGPEEVTEERPTKRRRGRWRKRGRRGKRAGGPSPSGEPVPTGDAVTGDDFGDEGPRELDLGATGGEQQLSSAQIDAAVGSVMGRIRRCPLLAHEEADIRGRVVFRLQIRSSGQVGAVQLSGPAALTTGEAGGCLRGAARRISFPSFDGPDMRVSYPVTFD